ncbi:MAG: FAD-dependent oxidoreductase [Clostridiales bacterium]|nr:FAD-dependent oxidoreductase [Clostridiales bacterium]
MGPKYKNLQSPLKIRNYILKNRLAASNSLPHFLQGPESYPADSVIAHFENKAKGAAIVTCMGINNFSRGKQQPMNLDFGHFPDFDLYDTCSQNYLLQLSDAIHYYDSIACMGIFVGPPSAYPLMRQKSADNPDDYLESFRESAGNEKPFAVPKPYEFELELIPAHEDCIWYDSDTLSKIADSYAEQASILQTLDYDMVSIHACYRANLTARMFSPITNKRTDDWGGCLKNRMRFPLMVLERVRDRVGKDFLIELIWSAEDIRNGYTIDESVEFLNTAKKYIDVVQLRAPSADVAHPTSFNPEHEPFVRYAEYIKKRVEGLVIGTVGGYLDLDACEQVIAEGKADLIYAARAWISNPDYGRLALEGRNDDVVPCLRCNKCHGRGEKDPFVSVCSVNPLIGLEHKIPRMGIPPKRSKKVAVIGGGPAGMRCALYLKERGHIPVIFEASDTLGGVIKHSDYVDFKWTLQKFKDYLIYQVWKQGIETRFSTRATPEMLKNEPFDVVVTALGAVPVKPSIPGLDGERVCFAETALSSEASLGKNVVIIGGGEVGVETGIHLARRGHKVTVLEMRDKLAADSTLIHYYSIFKEVWEAEANLTGIVNARVHAVKDGRVCYTDTGGEKSIEADTIVISVGMKALADEALSFYGVAGEFYMIGDCKRPGTIQTAMRAAYAVASRI